MSVKGNEEKLAASRENIRLTVNSPIPGTPLDRDSSSRIRGIETPLHGVHDLILITVSSLSGFLKATWSFSLAMPF